MINTISPKIIQTEDGSATIVHPVYGDTYHSLRGAVGESEHVFIRNGLERIGKKHLKILEIGFGSGLNALVTLKHITENRISAEYHTVEKFPVSAETVLKTGYADIFPGYHDFFYRMHDCPWNEKTRLSENFFLLKLHKCLSDTEFDTTFDVIYFDAFSPDTQPELWTTEVFTKLFECTEENGILTTYSSKGSVKQALRNAGYTVKRLGGALGKRHMLNAIKESDGKKDNTG
ncbi:MAG: tRNA (5-methylaminomethyl-2-thiouridine)(34)-methyltransferase MnmD [Rikenellaceae bacterium]|nr:tRNA (5-methylaminomethyl-2-thiouridine)(34)-methyltransferase MnmD [Rikenellaceae bacterium]